MGLKRKAAFLTLGCKVNQYETDAMRNCFGMRDIRSWILVMRRMSM